MKTINTFIKESKTITNSLRNLNDIEIELTNFFMDNIIDNNISIDMKIGDFNINFNDEEFIEKNQCVGVLLEQYIKHILNTDINKKEKSAIINILKNYNGDNYGEYTKYDFIIGDVPFEIKCSADFNFFYVSDKQKQQIGPDALFILINFELSKNNILIKELIVKQRKNCKITGGNYLR